MYNKILLSFIYLDKLEVPICLICTTTILFLIVMYVKIHLVNLSKKLLYYRLLIFMPNFVSNWVSLNIFNLNIPINLKKDCVSRKFDKLIWNYI
jgi:hypothetical protein